MLRSPQRPGRLNGPWFAFLGSVAVLAALVGLLLWNPQQTDKRPLFVYCEPASGAPVEEAARAYEKQYGVRIQLTYGGSETLLTNLAVSGRGDLYIPADDDYLDRRGRKVLSTSPFPWPG